MCAYTSKLVINLNRICCRTATIEFRKYHINNYAMSIWLEKRRRHYSSTEENEYVVVCISSLINHECMSDCFLDAFSCGRTDTPRIVANYFVLIWSYCRGNCTLPLPRPSLSLSLALHLFLCIIHWLYMAIEILWVLDLYESDFCTLIKVRVFKKIFPLLFLIIESCQTFFSLQFHDNVICYLIFVKTRWTYNCLTDFTLYILTVHFVSKFQVSVPFR